MKWVVNKTEDVFTWIWGGEKFVISNKKPTPVPDDVLNAFVPQPDIFKKWIEGASDVVSTTRAVLETILHRWSSDKDNKVSKYVKLTGNKEEDVKAILGFLNKFEVKDGIEDNGK